MGDSQRRQGKVHHHACCHNEGKTEPYRIEEAFYYACIMNFKDSEEKNAGDEGQENKANDLPQDRDVKA